MTAQPIWITEHYWPGVAEELVLAQAQRLARVADWWGTVVLPGQQTAFGLFVAHGPDEVRDAVARVAAPSVHVTAGLVLLPGAAAAEAARATTTERPVPSA
jgi:hypothetical protein